MKHVKYFEDSDSFDDDLLDDEFPTEEDEQQWTDEELDSEITEATEEYVENLLDSGFSKDDIINAISTYFAERGDDL